MSSDVKFSVAVAILTIASQFFAATVVAQQAPNASQADSLKAQHLPGAIIGRFYRAALPLSSAVGDITSRVIGGSLPRGIGIDGIWIAGRAEEEGIFRFTIYARDEMDQTDECRFVLEVLRPPSAPLVIGEAELAPAVIGRPYYLPLPCTGGVRPLTFVVSQGRLPEGISLDQSVLRGSANNCGNYDFTITARDSLGRASEGSFSLQVIPPPPSPLRIITHQLPIAYVGEAYAAVLRVAGGRGPFTWQVVRGSLPDWAQFRNGIIAGVPGNITMLGQSRFSIRLQDSIGTTVGPVELVLEVEGNPRFDPPVLAFDYLPAAIVNDEYSAAIPIKGGMSPYTVEIVAGTLPPGLALESDGRIQGRPIREGNWILRLRLRDKLGQSSEDQKITISVKKAAEHMMRFQKFVPPPAIVGKQYDFQMPVFGGVLPYEYVLQGQLPPDLEFDNALGALHGKPDLEGKWKLTVEVRDASAEGASASQTFEMIVVPNRIDHSKLFFAGGMFAGAVIIGSIFPIRCMLRRRKAPSTDSPMDDTDWKESQETDKN